MVRITKTLIPEKKLKNCYEVKYTTVQWYREMFYENSEFFNEGDEEEIIKFIETLKKYEEPKSMEGEIIHRNFYKDKHLFGDFYYFDLYYYDKDGNKYYCEIG